MAKLSKRQKALTAVDREKFYGVDEAIALVKGNATAKFDETIEVALNLGVDPRHADQMVRGVVSFPKAPARPSASRCSPRAQRPTRPRRPARTSSAPRI